MSFEFVIAVLVMLAIACALVLPPLWRGPRRGAYAVALALPVVAVLLYWRIGNPLALVHPPHEAQGTLDQAVDALAAQLRLHPDNLDGWLLLGRSRKQQQRYAEALESYRRALKLAPNEPDIMVEMAETTALQDPNHTIQGDALALLKQAQHIDPRNQRALWFLGVAAYQHQQYAEAAATWQPLLELVPDSTRPALRKQIDHARVLANLPPLPAEAPAASGPALLTARIDISPALRAKLAPDDVLFVYARMPDGPPMPLAVKRVPAKDFPVTIELADADGPMPTMRLSQQTTVDVQARVSHSGGALPESGDFETAPLVASVGAKTVLTLTIDRIHP